MTLPTQLQAQLEKEAEAHAGQYDYDLADDNEQADYVCCKEDYKASATRLFEILSSDSVAERWAFIPNYPDYLVSNRGRLMGRRGRKHFKLLTYQPNQRGYIKMLLYNDKGRQNWAIHALVLTAFVGPKPTQKHVCSHHNDIKTDNRLENLAWTTQKENAQQAVKNNLYRAAHNHPRAKLTKEQREIILREYKRTSYRHSNANELAERFGVGRGAIIVVVRKGRL